MKRSLVLVPIVLMIIFVSCSPAPLPQFTDPQWTAIAATQQVMNQTDREKIKAWLNNYASNYDKFVDLEKTMIGNYEVNNISFPTPYYFEVDMSCTCVRDTICCDPEQMFVLILQRMAQSRDQIVSVVPTQVQQMNLVCFNNNRSFAVVYVAWDNVKKFLYEQMTGRDLGFSVIWHRIP